MKKIIFSLVVILPLFSFAQNNVGIGTNTPDASALLELNATNKGLLIPKMTVAQKNAILLPATGLLIYQTDGTPGFYYNAGPSIVPIWTMIGSGSSSSNSWALTGNAGTNTTSNFIGTTDDQPLMFRLNNKWAGKWDTKGRNYFIGDSCGANTTASGTIDGQYNIAIGDSAFLKNTTGHWNTAFGGMALYTNTDGSLNTAIGHKALYNNLTGSANTAIGFQTLFSNTTGGSNIAFGTSALYYNTKGSRNLAMGPNALDNNSEGNDNVGIGYQSLSANQLGDNNIGIGYKTLDSNRTDNNIALGFESMLNTKTGANNIAMGHTSLRSNVGGYGNVSLGYLTLNQSTSGHSNVAIGTAALFGNLSGNYNIGIGYTANTGNSALTNAVAIGAFSKVDTSNAIVLGAINGVNESTADTKVGIGTTTPRYKLHVKSNTSGNGGLLDGIMVENQEAIAGEVAISFRNITIPSTRQWSIGMNESTLLAINYGAGFTNPNTRIAIDTLGNVGIGTVNPNAKLDVDGNLRVAGDITIPSGSDYSYATTKTKNLNIPHAAFQLIPVNGTSTAGISTTSISNGLWVNGGTSGIDAIFDAPINLPIGAIVTGITVWVRDNTSSYEVAADLVEINGITHTVLTSLSGTGVVATPGDTFITATSLSHTISGIRSYYLRFRTKENNGNLRIYNARIAYTIDKV